MGRLTASWRLAAALALLAAGTSAQAGGFAVREQSAEAEGLSYAGAASGSGGLSSVFWNPATITMRPGINSELVATGVFPESIITPLPPTPTIAFGDSGNIGQDAFVPASYHSYQVSDRVFLGLATNGAFGYTTKPNQDWAGQVYSRSSRIFSLAINPIIGLKLTDWLSVGGGPVVEYFQVKQRRALSPLPGAPSSFLTGDAWDPGFTMGLTATPWAGTQFGVGYRSSIGHTVDGQLGAAVGVVLPVQARLDTPDLVTVGLSQAITPRLRAHLGFEWQNWRRLGTVAVQAPASGATVTTLPLNYGDGFLYSIGAEYDVTDRLTARAGFAYEQSPVTDAVRSTALPDNDRFWASLGASFRWSHKLQVDLAYSHLFVRDTRIAIVPGHQAFVPPLAFVGEAKTSVDIVSLGLKYRWDNPAVAVPAPVVAKY